MGFKPAVSLTEQIADHLSSEIIRGRLAPTERRNTKVFCNLELLDWTTAIGKCFKKFQAPIRARVGYGSYPTGSYSLIQ
jgi:hypothetical protein